MARLDDIFEVKNGLASSHVVLLRQRTATSIPYVRPSKTQQRTIAGWVERLSIPPNHRFPRHSVFVSTNGEGSHTFAYVSDFEFAANSDVSVLIPKRDMGLAEKIFYARTITLNRDKFSYGRKPKGERLKSINLPDRAPAWVNASTVQGVAFDVNFRASESRATASGAVTVGKETIRLDELFEVQYGTNLELNHLTQDTNGINFVARTAKNNGVSARVRKPLDMEPTEGMALTVAGGGSVLETFLQIEPFYSGRDLYFLRPKTPMTIDELLFYATCVRANQYKYSYGRQANKTLRGLQIPSFDSLPSWVNGSVDRVSKEIKNLVSNLT